MGTTQKRFRPTFLVQVQVQVSESIGDIEGRSRQRVAGPHPCAYTGAGAGVKSTQEPQLDPRDCRRCLLQFERGCRAECTRIDNRACGIEQLKFLETSALSERPTGLKVGAQLEVGEQLTSHCRVYLKWGCPRSDRRD